MRKLLILVLVISFLEGCASGFFPPVSTIYAKANANHVTDNGDGSTTFEFKFVLDPFDTRKALQRIDEFLAGYASDKKFTGYAVEKVNDKAVEKGTSGSDWVAPASATFVMSAADKTTVSGKDRYGRILVQARFTTQQ